MTIIACILQKSRNNYVSLSLSSIKKKSLGLRFSYFNTYSTIANSDTSIINGNEYKTSLSLFSNSILQHVHHHHHDIPSKRSQYHPNHQILLRHFGRKAGKMGKHLETLNEIAHREEHEKAKEKRKLHKKGGGGTKKKNNIHDGIDESSSMTNASTNTTQSFSNNDGMSNSDLLQEDETETIFDHGGNDNDNDENIPSLPSIDDVKSRMMKVVDSMEESFKSIRGAEATPELFDSLQVKAYGSFTPLNGVAQVVINTPTRATISCFDPDVAPAVRDAVRDMAGMNFNPMIEDGVVIVPIPRVSAETRKVSDLFLSWKVCVK